MRTESTEIDNIINIFIYETGGVKIMSFMSSLFRPHSPSIKHQRNFYCEANFRPSDVFLPQHVSEIHLKALQQDFLQIIYGSIFARNKILRALFPLLRSQRNGTLLLAKIDFQ